MIKTEFEIVKDVFEGAIVIDLNTPTITIAFSGNTVRGIDPNIDIYGRVLLCKMENIKRLYIVLKNKTIFCLDHLTEKHVLEIVKHHEDMKEFESFKLLEACILL